MSEKTDKQGKKRQPPPEKYRWKKGQSGNPKGRPPKHLCLTSRLWDMLHEKCPQPAAKGKTWLDVIVNQVLVHASKGNSGVIKEVFERVEGKVALPISNPDGSALFDMTEEKAKRIAELTLDSITGRKKVLERIKKKTDEQ